MYGKHGFIKDRVCSNLKEWDGSYNLIPLVQKLIEQNGCHFGRKPKVLKPINICNIMAGKTSTFGKMENVFHEWMALIIGIFVVGENERKKWEATL